MSKPIAAPAAELANGPATLDGGQEIASGGPNYTGTIEEMVSGMAMDPGVPDITQILKQLENADHALQFFENKAEEVLAKLNAMLVEAGISPDDDESAVNESKTFDEAPSGIDGALDDEMKEFDVNQSRLSTGSILREME
ncbi:hypothetical protein HDU97_010387 [Phlyctochytrium planicorne]|nr:hypothetical protein HDU97_010387 [Phlyctochytrium planicorne]